MANVYKSSEFTFSAGGSYDLITAPAACIVNSLIIYGYTSGTVTFELEKVGSTAVTIIKVSSNGEQTSGPLVLEVGDVLSVTGVSGITAVASYVYSATIADDLSIDALTDVNIAGINDGDILVWDDALGYFQPTANTGGGGGSTTLSGLTDTSIVSLANNDILRYNGSAWQNEQLYGSDITLNSGTATTVTGKLSSLETDVDNAAGLITTNINDISALESRADGHDTDVLNLQNNLNTANANIASNDSDIATLQTDITDAGTLINTNAANIATNTANISNNDTDILNLQNSVNANAGYISDINNGVGNVIAVKVDGQADITGTVTLAEGPNVTLTQSGSTITIDSSGGGGGGSDSFNTIAVSGQTDVVAESGNDTLNLVGGTGITITTDASTDTVNFAADTSVLATDAELASLATTVGANTAAISANDGEIAVLQAATHVNSFNGLTGAVTISAGSGINLSPSGNDIEIVSTATSTTINNNAAGRIITGSNTADTLNAETTLSWVSNTLLVAGDAVLTGDVTAVEANVGTINYSKQITIQTPSTTFPAQGELSPIAGTGLTAGDLYYLNSSGVWTIADATAEASCKNMLGIAISATEVMIRGHLSYPAYAGFSAGEPLYVKPSAAGGITDIVPFTSGHIVRKIGFCLDGSVRSIYFNPSNDYFEVE